MFVISNLLGMLRKVFMVLSSKFYLIDFFKDAHMPMPDISGKGVTGRMYWNWTLLIAITNTHNCVGR